MPAAAIGISAPVVGAILFTIANFAYQAALIYYDATLSSVSYPGDAGQAVRDRRRDRLHGDAADRARCCIVLDPPVDGYFSISMALFAVFAVPIFLVVRERGTGAPAFTCGRRAPLVRAGRGCRSRHAREVPGLRPLPRSAASSTPTR